MPPKKRKIPETVEEKVAEPDSKKIKEMDSSDLNLDDFLEENDPTADKFLQIANSPDFTKNVLILESEKRSKLWSVCHLFVAESILNIIETKEEEEEETEKGITSDKILKICIDLGKATIETLGSNDIPEKFHETAKLLYKTLPSFSKNQNHIKENIAKLCELWYSKDYPAKDEMTIYVIQYLIEKAAQPNGTKTDIKRINTIQETLSGIQFQENERLKGYVCKAARLPNFYRSNEGQKFIVYLLGLDVNLMKEIHKSIKSVIAGSSKQDALHIGHIYYKAWNSGVLTENLEEECIQNFMYHCVLANPKAKLFDPLMTILSHFHLAKNNRKIQTMVQKLWEPLLWRYLKVANGHVRMHATQILAEAFPIENPNDELEIRANAQEVQIQLFQNLLQDDVVDVRVAAIHGVTNILARYWTIFASDDIEKFMKLMILHLANDMASPKVRIAVVKGMIYLIQNCPRAHAYLKKILPKLQDLLFDSNESVKLSLIDLLISVKSIKTIQFWQICPLENILDRLMKDKKSVSAKITQLLFNSFFPLDQDDEAKLERCIFLIDHDLDAARKFYLNVDKLMKLHDAVKFMLSILVHLKKQAIRNLTPEENEDKENTIDTLNIVESKQNKDGTISIANDTLQQDLNDPYVVRGLIDVVVILWMNRCQELAEKSNDEYRSLLEKKSPKILTLLFKVYKSTEVNRSVVYLCSLLPHSSVQTIASYCLSQFKSASVIPQVLGTKFLPWTLDVHGKLKEELPVTTYLDALCNWRRVDDVLEIISLWITNDLALRQNGGSKIKSKKKNKGVTFNENQEKPRPGYGLLMLQYILNHPLNRAIVLKKNLIQLEELVKVIQKYVPHLERALHEDVIEDEIDLEGTHEVLASAWNLLLQLQIITNSGAKKSDENILKLSEEHLEWTKTKVLPQIQESALAKHVMNTLMMMCSNLATLNICDSDWAKLAIQRAESVAEKETQLNVIKVVVPLLTEVIQWSNHYQKEISIQSAIDKVCMILEKNSEITIPKELHMEMKKVWVNLLNVVSDKEPIFMVFTQILKSHIKSTIIENEQVALISKSTISNFIIDILSTKRYVKSYLQYILTTMKIETFEYYDLAFYLTVVSSVYHQLKSSSPKSDLTNILHEVNQRKGTINQDQIDVDIINSFNQIFNQTQKSLGIVVS